MLAPLPLGNFPPRPITEQGVVPPVPTMYTEGPLGRPVSRREGAAKLCGRACYVDDLPRRDVWLGGTVRADVAHARLVAIQYDQRFDWSRVVVVAAADIPGENVVPVVSGKRHLISCIEQDFLPILFTQGTLQPLGLDSASALGLTLQ